VLPGNFETSRIPMICFFVNNSFLDLFFAISGIFPAYFKGEITDPSKKKFRVYILYKGAI
jgi:hypothetical protein